MSSPAKPERKGPPETAVKEEGSARRNIRRRRNPGEPRRERKAEAPGAKIEDESAPEAGDAPVRRRRVRKPRARKSSDGAPADPATERASSAPRERPPRVEVPAELIGKSSSGIIFATRNRRGQFGFITIGQELNAETARVYFNFASFEDADFIPRRGYAVTFNLARDDSGKVFATEVRLTAAGRDAATAREAQIAAEKAAGPKSAAAGGAAERKERPPRAEGEEPRRRVRRVNPEDERTLNLSVTCQGKADTKVIEVQVSRSIGKIKHAAIEAFEAPISYNVFARVSSTNPNGDFLTKALLRELVENDAIHLREPTAEEAAKSARA